MVAEVGKFKGDRELCYCDLSLKKEVTILEELVLLLLDKCKKIYLELLDADSRDQIGYENFPKYAIITYCGGKSKLLITENALKTWKFENGNLTEIPDNSLKPSFTPANGKCGYFSEAAFAFSINKTSKKASLSYLIAPRYGCGLEYDVVENQNKIAIENQKMKWMA